MVQPASNIVLSEVDLELTLLGSLFMAPGAFALVAENITPAWFSDPFGRYLFESAQRIHQAGNRLSPPAVLASLPEDCGGITRGALYARACASALPENAIGGLVHTLRDRWARRELIYRADMLKERAVSFGEDPFDLANEAISDLNTVTSSRAESKGGSLESAFKRLNTSFEKPDHLRGATTGLSALDTKLNGYKAGQLYVIAGRPGMGKSAFMCSSLRRTAQMGKPVAIFSLEMTAEEIATRCISDALDDTRAPSFGAILKGQFSEAERGDIVMAQDSLAGLDLHIEDEARLTFAEIAGRARMLKAQLAAKGKKLSVVCIDHMGLVTPSNRYAGNKVAEAGEVSGQARALAKELDCCVILLCQLSREVEKRDDKRPIMSDLRWSGEIEQDAHVVAFLYREAYYLAQDAGADPYAISAAKFKIEFLIRKNRNGETADVNLWCSIAHSSIRDDI